jgi:DNA-binding CsgD family transcriptional regulator
MNENVKLMVATPRERITNKVQICAETGCWNWKGAKQVRGYGELSIGGKKYAAHRLSYALFHGQWPGRLYVCHSCDNVSCVNPDHLFLGTQKDNLQDMAAKGRSMRGERNAQAKLRDDDVKAIRASGYTKQKLADQYGVSLSTIQSIIQRKAWNHVN